VNDFFPPTGLQLPRYQSRSMRSTALEAGARVRVPARIEVEDKGFSRGGAI
jgi:hypothetical protein